MSAKRTAVGHICKSEHIIKSKLAEDCAADNVTDEDGPDHDGNTNDAYDDDIGRDKECGENAEPSSPAKKRKGNKQFTDDRRKSLQRRYSSLGEKWTLGSGTVVEDILFEAGKQMKDFYNLPDGSPYSKEASDYLDEFEREETLKNLQDLLDRRPRHIESQLVHECLSN
ncbi:hypothetical protein BGZ97_005195, partial [Linnemannia gamsii]